MAQVDNETPNWEYLAALRELGLKLGIEPVFYTKTGWPSPSQGYPANYPMLPFFGGCVAHPSVSPSPHCIPVSLPLCLSVFPSLCLCLSFSVSLSPCLSVPAKPGNGWSAPPPALAAASADLAAPVHTMYVYLLRGRYAAEFWTNQMAPTVSTGACVASQPTRADHARRRRVSALCTHAPRACVQCW